MICRMLSVRYAKIVSVVYFIHIIIIEAVQFNQRIRQSEEKANDHNTFFTDLHGKKRKNDMIAQYLGKGIFNMDK